MVDTIIYGSSDAGINIHSDNSEFNLKIERISKILNTKAHIVGRLSPKLIYGPGDLEGHMGFDFRFYLLDFARYCPPEPPKPEIKGSNLFRLLRPEFVKKYKSPLSADGFSNIGYHDNIIHNQEIREAYNYLLTDVIKESASQIDQFISSLSSINLYDITTEIVSLLHKNGVNVRYMGLVRNALTSNDGK